MRTNATLLAGALCALALAAPAGARPITDSDRAYAALITANANAVSADMSSLEGVVRRYTSDPDWAAHYAAAAARVHGDCLRGLRISPTPRFRGSKRLYDAALRDFDRSAWTLLPRSVARADPAGLGEAERAMDEGGALMTRAVTQARRELR